MKTLKIRCGDGEQYLSVSGERIASVLAMNHDETVRRCFRLYRCESGFVAQIINEPDSPDPQFDAVRCHNILDIYSFFGNEPLANYLYGRLQIDVPGLYCES